MVIVLNSVEIMINLLLLCIMISIAAGSIDAESSTAYNRDHNAGRLSRVLIRHGRYNYYMYTRRDGNTIPAAPVQGQASSCSLDLSNELLGGVRAACMQGTLDKERCCPVLAAWLMAARAKVALHPPLQQEPGMPQLPDDSLVCIASLKAALAARGITIFTPASPSNASEDCDVVTCFCGIHLSHLTSQSCPLPFSHLPLDKNSSAANSSSSLSQPTFPHLVQHNSKQLPLNHHNYSLNEQFSKHHSQLHRASNLKHNHLINNELTIKTGKDVPLQPSQNDTSIDLPVSSNSSHEPGLSSLLQQLAANCTDHSYRGCTRCLKTLTKEMRSEAAKEIIRGSSEKAQECEMIGLMWLLELNKTLYIPTVSAVVRALLYNYGELHPNITKCSLDTDNMPLALDYAELLSASSIHHHSPPPLALITLLISLITFMYYY